MSFFFPRFTSGNGGEFAPLFRMLDDYATQAVARPGGGCSSSTRRSFQPRFDVREVKDGYELQGELPGIDQKDVSIEFTDPQTLQIRGRTEHSREKGNKSAPVEAEPASSGKATGPKTASVEDEESADYAVIDSNSTNDEASQGVATPGTAATATETAPTPAPIESTTEKAHYWVSERSVGEFQRTFNFPTRLDQDNVRASLKNGILSITVPKAAPPATRKINIE